MDRIYVLICRVKEGGKMMQRKKLSLILAIVSSALLFASAVWADIPAPPANQQLGINDGVFNNLLEAECRVCHEDPDIVSGGSNIPDRHHLLINSTIQTGECSVNSNSCLSDNDCDSGICSRNNVPCSADSDCPDFDLGETCGEICIGETVVPYIDSNNDGINDTLYDCLNCHALVWDPVSMSFVLEAFRDCNLCHIQIAGEGSVHHLLPVAQGTDSPLGNPDVGDCTPCHGTLVDDIGDGHQIPTYNPSLVTPLPSGGDGQPLNSRGNGAGACNYCHDSGADTITGVQVFTNAETHHNTGVFQSETGVVDYDVCQWCHNMSLPDELVIRTCEGCHGFEALHNIQLDSNGDDIIDPGSEMVGYGHIGNNDDCWGCHGFLQAIAPGTGPVTPFISSSNVLSMTTGTDTVVILSGVAFTNHISGFELTSNVVLIAADSSSVTLTPDSITSRNYSVRAVKGTAESNPVVISVTPEVTMADSSCNRKRGVLTINGAGFGKKIEGTDDYINVQVDGQSVEIISWSDTQIKASVSSCSKRSTITVNALYGSASSADNGGGGKPDKPCKGKRC
jgi:hypothetical protein